MNTKTTATDAYLARAAAIHNKLTRLQQLADDHFGHYPDAIHWGHVGDLGRVDQALDDLRRGCEVVIARLVCGDEAGARFEVVHPSGRTVDRADLRRQAGIADRQAGAGSGRDSGRAVERQRGRRAELDRLGKGLDGWPIAPAAAGQQRHQGRQDRPGKKHGKADVHENLPIGLQVFGCAGAADQIRTVSARLNERPMPGTTTPQGMPLLVMDAPWPRSARGRWTS